jgi:hypothetical protein
MTGSLTLLPCGDVMLGRGIDQISSVAGDPLLQEPEPFSDDATNGPRCPQDTLLSRGGRKAHYRGLTCIKALSRDGA